MDEYAARTPADAHAQTPVTTPVRRLARVRITSIPNSDAARVPYTNPYRAAGDARRDTRPFPSVAHLDNLPWYSAPLPPAHHDCWRQTWHANPDGTVWLERCPCGGARTYHDGQLATPCWFGRNTRATGRVLSPSIIRRASTWLRRKDRP